MNDVLNAGQDQDNSILVKQLECKAKIEKICKEYGLLLMPVTQIVGNQVNSTITLVEAPVSPTNEVDNG